MGNFLGTGFKFPFSVGPNGGIQLSRYETNIEESVRIIIGTALGERQMRPEWGCRVHDFVFAPNNTSTQTLVAHHGIEALVRFVAHLGEKPGDSRHLLGEGGEIEVDVVAAQYLPGRLRVAVKQDSYTVE